MFLNLILATLFSPIFNATPNTYGCFTDPQSGLEVCTQPVEPSPRPEEA